jgi:hypothetical protein
MATVAVLSAWMGCLCMLWMGLLGCSGMWLTTPLAGMGLALAICSGLPSWLVRSIHRIQALRSPDPLVHEAVDDRVAGSAKADVRAAMRLLAIFTFLAVLGAGISMAVIFWTSGLLESAVGALRMGPVAWGILHVLVVTIVFLPAASGLTLLFPASCILRSGTTHDAFADCAREWLAGAAGGIGLLGLLILSGINLLAVGPLLGMVAGGLAVVWWLRKDFAKRSGRLVRPVRSPSMVSRIQGSLVPAGIAVALGLQVRILADVLGASLEVQTLWVSLSLLLVVRFQSDTDGKGRMPGRRQGAGSIIGVASVLLGQLALAGMSLVSPSHGWVCLLLAAGMQGPLAAMGGILISRQRQRFVNDGARPRQYLAQAGLGLAVGFLLHHGLWSSGAGLLLSSGLWLALAAWAIVNVLRNCNRSADVVRWLSAGLAVLLVLAFELAVVHYRLAGSVGSLAPGRGLTCLEPALSPGTLNFLPERDTWRSEDITLLTRQAMGADQAGGSWWIVAQSPDHLVPALPDSIQVVAGAVDPEAVFPGPWAERLSWGPRRSWVRGAFAGRSWIDGIALACPPGDHPQTMRQINLGLLQRIRGQLSGPAGQHRPLLIRSQLTSGQAGRLLAMAVTFGRAIGSGYLAVKFLDQKADFLLLGPAEAVERPQSLHGVFVVDLQELVEGWPGVQPLRTFAPGGLPTRATSVPDLVDWLQRQER